MMYVRSMTYSEVSISFGADVRRFKYRSGSTDAIGVKQVFEERCYDLTWSPRFSELRRLINERLKRGLRPLIIDCGANIGAATLFFAMNYRGVPVAAIEPHAENYRLLCENTKGLDVRTFHAAIAGRAGQVRVMDGLGGFDSFRTEFTTDGGREVVPAMTIADIIALYGEGYYPLIVKVDIEGAEKELFATATEWVDPTPVIIAELHDWMLPKSGVTAPFLRTIAPLDRDFLLRGENVISIRNQLD
jgi:FkbM family methyltransferase